jgi:hypothetical protein
MITLQLYNFPNVAEIRQQNYEPRKGSKKILSPQYTDINFFDNPAVDVSCF